jgi:hypothetical protein
VVIAGPVVMALVVLVVMVEPVVIAGPEVLVYTLVLPPMMRDAQQELVMPRCDLELPMAVDQPVRYLIYAIGWYCRCILRDMLLICSGDVYLMILIA